MPEIAVMLRGMLMREARLSVLPRALVLAWIGGLAHDLVEFGRPSPEHSLPALAIVAALLLAWRVAPGRQRVVAAFALAYGVLGLLGAALSVLPLSVFPWAPEQTVSHYLAHLVWLLSVVPLVWVSAVALRR